MGVSVKYYYATKEYQQTVLVFSGLRARNQFVRECDDAHPIAREDVWEVIGVTRPGRNGVYDLAVVVLDASESRPEGCVGRVAIVDAASPNVVLRFQGL